MNTEPLPAHPPRTATYMRIKCSKGASLWKEEATYHELRVVVLKPSVAKAGIVEIARALARKAAREDHAWTIARRS